MVNNLVEYLKKCDEAYYNTDHVLVSNDTYDALVETLRRLNPEHPYLKKVGASVQSSSKKLGRLIPMGTLSKYHTDEEVKSWLSSEEGTILLSPKYDGFGIELIYENGRLSMASTRGDGHVGEDVLEATLRISGVPVVLPDEWSDLKVVRGEAIIPRRYHEQVKSLGYSAMRNAVPGIVRSNRKDALIFVEFVAYEFFDGTNDRVQQRVKYSDLFNVEDFTEFSSTDFDSILACRNHFGDVKDSYDYEIDGTVLKSNIIKEDELLCPRHQIAWKFVSKYKETILRDIEFNVGATGAISVVGIFDEVEFHGAKLKRASFGSLPLYEEMQPAVGDMIEVSRRGDIIPWIENVVQRNSDNYKSITVCPCCGSRLIDYQCSNKECPDRVKLKIYQFIKSIGVKGIGYALIVALVDAGIIRQLSDIYKIDARCITNLPRQGSSSVEKWKVLQWKEINPLQLLCAYPFEHAGKSIWTALLSRYTLREILDLDIETLQSANIKGIGSSKIYSLVSQLEESREEILELMDLVELK